MKDILGLEEVERIQMLARLGDKSDTFQRIIGIKERVKHLHKAFDSWINQDSPTIEPTWKKLLLIPV